MEFKFRQIELQFRLNTAPNAIRKLEPETPEEHKERIGRKPNGVKVMEASERCSLADLIEDIESEGYSLIDAFCQERVDDSLLSFFMSSGKTYHMVRFVFVYKNFPAPAGCLNGPFFDVYRKVARNELLLMCKSAIYQVKVFSNPLFEGEKMVEEFRTMNINLKFREPLFYPNGKPVLVWEKDHKVPYGKPVLVWEKDHKVPLKSKFTLHMENGKLRLFENTMTERLPQILSN